MQMRLLNLFRHFSTKTTVNPNGLYTIRPEFFKNNDSRISNDDIRKSTCFLSLPPLNIPKKLDDAIIRFLKKHSRTLPADLVKKSKILQNYLWKRTAISERQAKKVDQSEEIVNERKIGGSDTIDKLSLNFSSIHNIKKGSRSHQILTSKNIENWSSLNYHDDHTCEIYLVSKIIPNFAVGCRVLYEIRKRAPLFVPRSFFDFGSGTGSLTWAANTVWPSGCIREHCLVDASSEMLKIAEELIAYQVDEPTEEQVPDHIFPGVYLRQFLPSQNLKEENLFDLVISGNSLLDVAGQKERNRIVSNLWEKTGSFLVLIEQGTKNGFKTLLEARDFLIKLEDPEFSIFAPCPHSLTCGKADEQCNFLQPHYKLNLTKDTNEPSNELFSYMIFAKGDWRQKYLVNSSANQIEARPPPLPRLVNFQTGNTSKSCDVDLCQASGKIQRYQFTKSQTDVDLYRYLSKSDAGNLFPADFDPEKLAIKDE